MEDLKIVSMVAELIFENFKIISYTSSEEQEFVDKVEGLWLDIPAIQRKFDKED